MSAKPDIESMTDEEELHKLLSKTEDFDLRKKIRARLKSIREEESARFEKQKLERNKDKVSAIQLKQQQAEQTKALLLKSLDDKAKEKRSKPIDEKELYIRKKHADADIEKQQKIKNLTEMGSILRDVAAGGDEVKKKAEENAKEVMSKNKDARDAAGEETTTSTTTTDKGEDGNKRTTTTSKTKKITKDDKKTITTQRKEIKQEGGPGGTFYKMPSISADELSKRISESFGNLCKPATDGAVTVKTEIWDSRTSETESDQKTRRFRAKTDNDNKNNLNQDSKVSIQRSPSAIKELMLNWCRQCTAGYEHVDIKNFSSSWNDGMAFCALIHHFYPTAFDYSKLQPKYRKGNFKLGFTVSEKLGGVAPLLDIEDMVRMKNPDWKCVFTYVQQFYRRFRNWDEEQEELRLKKEQENADKKENEIEDTSSGDKETLNES